MVAHGHLTHPLNFWFKLCFPRFLTTVLHGCGWFGILMEKITGEIEHVYCTVPECFAGTLDVMNVRTGVRWQGCGFVLADVTPGGHRARIF